MESNPFHQGHQIYFFVFHSAELMQSNVRDQSPGAGKDSPEDCVTLGLKKVGKAESGKFANLERGKGKIQKTG
jgi:hypothetical protein